MCSVSSNLLTIINKTYLLLSLTHKIRNLVITQQGVNASIPVLKKAWFDGQPFDAVGEPCPPLKDEFNTVSDI